MRRDLVALHRVLRDYLSWGAEITRVTPMSFGYSNGTYLLEGADRVLRMPPEEDGLLPPYDMARQHEIYRRVAGVAGGPPVPVVFELCEDLSIAGVPFYVMERLPGETFDRHALPAWLTSSASNFDAFCRAWSDLFVAVHCMPAGTLDGPLRTSRSQAEEWLAIAEREDAPPLIREILADAATDPPPDTGPPTCVHGDPNLTNVLWDGPRALGLLDWELSGIGEPFSDLAFLLTFLRDEGEPDEWGIGGDGCWAKPAFVRYWEGRTGRTVHQWRRHELLAMARLATIVRIGDNLVARGAKSDGRFSVLAAKLPSYMARLARRWSRRHIEDQAQR